MSATALSVHLGGGRVEMAAGTAAFGPARDVYRDAPDEVLGAIREDIEKGMAWREAVRKHLEHMNSWLLRVVLESARTLWLEQHPLKADSWVLDVGAGWGQWAIPAAAGCHVVAIEPNPSRLRVIKAIAEQEDRAGRMFFVGAPLEEVDFPKARFDQIFCIGVLEWVPRFRPDLEPIRAQTAFLRRLRQLLAPQGKLLIGIENRLGLKYLLGAPDDHTGLSGISVLDAAAAARKYLEKTGKPLDIFTHSMEEYRRMLLDSEFQVIEFYAAYPDYKVPRVIVPVAGGAADAHCLSGEFIPEHNGADGSALGFQEALASHYRSLGALNIAGAFAPSFFIRAR
jgi:2-polyprenyl-3-methyl-5-hydroxy-6-metoxy-1,4-benzoquinol methylase